MSILYPTALDDDSTIPAISNNITELGGDAINALRDAVFALEASIGLNPTGTCADLTTRIAVSILPDGTVNPSALTSLGLITLPIYNNEIANNAGILESKLNLDYPTQNLYDLIQILTVDISAALGWINSKGVELIPHIAGVSFFHNMSAIKVDVPLLNQLKTDRNNTNLFTLVNDINTEFLNHQFADGSTTSTGNIITNNSSSFPDSYAHYASGLYIDTSRFSKIPQTMNDLQKFADFVDQINYGGLLQNLYTNGISRKSSSSSLTADGYGQLIIPFTQVTTYLRNDNLSSVPWDNINNGDDLISFNPSASDRASNAFDSKFALIKIGDIITINYGNIQVQSVIKEVKYITNNIPANKIYIVRINNKNLINSSTAIAQITKPLSTNKKYGALSLTSTASLSNPAAVEPSLIVGTPRGAVALGVNFNPDLIDSSHFNLTLILYPTGNPIDGQNILPPIDISGNSGSTPGQYTLDSIISTTNQAFRAPGYNYRFTAFSYIDESGNSNFGLTLDSYNNCGFSILSCITTSSGEYDFTNMSLTYPNNIIDVFATTQDALGLGPFNSGYATPLYNSTYGSSAQALIPTKIFAPLHRNNYYVNGVELDRLASDINQTIDGYGDGYWIGKISQITPSSGNVSIQYKVDYDLSSSGLEVGKTLTVQPLTVGSLPIVNCGRFIISSVNFYCADGYTYITVYDGVHGTANTGSSLTTTLATIGTDVALYFNSDSISFNTENANDQSAYGTFKRHFEIYIDNTGKTFSYERCRASFTSTSLTWTGEHSGTFATNGIVINGVNLVGDSLTIKLNIISVSPNLKGYITGNVNYINLMNFNYSNTTGMFNGNLTDTFLLSSTSINDGPTTYGKIGEITRFYDSSNIEYIDIQFSLTDTIPNISNGYLSFQLYPSLSFDKDVMLIGSCQYDMTGGSGNGIVNNIKDLRQFGNIAKEDLSTSALDYISNSDKLLRSNGIIRGFDFAFTTNNKLQLKGGIALVNGKLLSINQQTFNIPILLEYYSSAYYYITWCVCINSKGSYEVIPLLDSIPNNNNPTNSSRILTVYEPSGNYIINASTFSNIINNRKDLTVLYILFANVTYSGLSGTPMTGTPTGYPTISLQNISDCRKYITDIDSNLSLKLTDSNQGNFKSFDSILNWVNLNNNYNGVVSLRGMSNVATINAGNNVICDFTYPVIFDGENRCTLNFEYSLIIGSNVTFKNMTLAFTSLNMINIINNAQNIVFDNCTFEITGTAVNVIVLQGNNKNILINNCNISGSFANAIRIGDVSSNISITNCIFSSTYNPGIGPATNNGVLYNLDNFINSGNGYIYGLSTTTLDNIKIDNCIFNCNVTPFHVFGLYQYIQRYTFINFELNAIGAVLSNLTITNCKFNNLQIKPTLDDLSGAIAIINTVSPGTGSELNLQPTLLNSNISKNICIQNQSIVLTSVTTGGSGGKMEFPGLVVKNTSINNNICGTIGYWTADGANTTEYITHNYSSSHLYSDKSSGLTINDNTCHYIANVDSYCIYFLVSQKSAAFGNPSTNFTTYNCGNVTISNNKCNWIHVGYTESPLQNTSLNILNNSLIAYDTAFISNFNDIAGTGTTGYSLQSYGFAIFVSGYIYSTIPIKNNCLIEGNCANYGVFLTEPLNISETIFTYLGYIYSKSSCSIINNTLMGVDNTQTAYGLITLAGQQSNINNNFIYRKTNPINSYIAFVNEDTTVPDIGASTQGIITNNYFDSPYLSGTTEPSDPIPSVINLNANSVTEYALNWNISNNKNQTGYVSIPLTNTFPVYTSSVVIPNTTLNYTLEPYISSTYNSSNEVLFGGYKSNVLTIYDDATLSPSYARFLCWQENLNKWVPFASKIVSANIQAVSTLTSDHFPGGLNTSNGYLNMYLTNTKLPSNLSDSIGNSPFTNGADQSVNNGSTDNLPLTYVSISSTQLNSGIQNQSITLPLSVSNNYMVGGNINGTSGNLGKTISLSLTFNYKISTSATIYINPIVVKYRW